MYTLFLIYYSGVSQSTEGTCSGGKDCGETSTGNTHARHARQNGGWKRESHDLTVN